PHHAGPVHAHENGHRYVVAGQQRQHGVEEQLPRPLLNVGEEGREHAQQPGQQQHQHRGLPPKGGRGQRPRPGRPALCQHRQKHLPRPARGRDARLRPRHPRGHAAGRGRSAEQDAKGPARHGQVHLSARRRRLGARHRGRGQADGAGGRARQPPGGRHFWAAHLGLSPGGAVAVPPPGPDGQLRPLQH
nr:hypothetical protein [Tanacetum cinerariifolium]